MSNEGTNLALVPLHPGCANKYEPVVKAFPLVLGRTNLANWWWNSCPCEKYCRLHCKPVAQNIRSLSKVMLMVDSEAKMNAVGKNPHLITVTPERADQILRENDIVCVGRRDREPWMRFQVVRANAATNPRRSRRRERRRNSVDGQTRIVDIGRSNTFNPPEWISLTRKRKVSRISSTPNPSNNATQQNATATDHQKRRRKRLRDSSFRLGSRPFDEANSSAKLDKHSQTGGQHAPAHHMHLVVQDYENSAVLLESDRERRRKMSERSVAESQGGRLHGGRLPFVSKRIEEDVDERTPPTEEATKHSPEAIYQETSKDNSELQQQKFISQPPSAVDRDTAPAAKKTPEEQLNEEPEESNRDEWTQEGQPDSILVWNAPKQDDNGETTRDLTEEPNSKDDAGTSAQGADEGQMIMSAAGNTMDSSMLHMPAVASTYEGTNLSPPNRSSTNRTVQYSDKGLQYWQEIAKGKDGKVSDFRRALANLILTKNKDKEVGDSMWLPDLLDDEVA